MKRLIATLALVLLIIGCDGTITEPGGGRWSVTDRTDSFGEPYVRATLRAGQPISLWIECESGSLSLWVQTSFIVASGRIRYAFDGESPRTETWSEAHGYNGLFYRGNVRSFMDRIAASRELQVEIGEYAGRDRREVFDVRGLEAYLPRFDAACG